MKYDELYKTYYPMVYRLALLLLKNTQDAEDAAQAVFVKLMEKEPELADAEHLKAWLLTVTRNHCRDIHRSFWNKKRAALENCPEPAAVEPFDRQESLLFEIFQTLPTKQRETVYLYYFEDYSIKEIAAILNRKESTIQSQLSAARKKMKKQFSASKAAALVLGIVCMVSFSGMAADAATGGEVRAALHEMYTTVSALWSAEDAQVADETVTLPIQVYAPQLAGISSDYVILANERGLLIYDRARQGIADVIDLQEIDCNYLNADSIATRIFRDGDRLYLFNEALNEDAPETLSEIAYVYDLAMLYDLTNADTADDLQKCNDELTSDDTPQPLSAVTDQAELQTILDRWESCGSTQRCHTFDVFAGADFLDPDSEKYELAAYSRESLQWSDASGKNMTSCLVVFDDSEYLLYTLQSDGAIVTETLALTGQTPTASDDTTTPTDGEATQGLPAFAYSGDDDICAVVCAYMCGQEAKDGYLHEEADVYIPAPIIYGTAEKDGFLYVFCNMWSYWYYQNGNTLECESGGEAPCRLELVADPDAVGGYTVNDVRYTGDGAEYERGIREFCEGFDGMADRYFSNENERDRESRTELIRMYVTDNQLPIRYYKDYGWDPVSVE